MRKIVLSLLTKQPFAVTLFFKFFQSRVLGRGRFVYNHKEVTVRTSMDDYINEHDPLTGKRNEPWCQRLLLGQGTPEQKTEDILELFQVLSPASGISNLFQGEDQAEGPLLDAGWSHSCMVEWAYCQYWEGYQNSVWAPRLIDNHLFYKVALRRAQEVGRGFDEYTFYIHGLRRSKAFSGSLGKMYLVDGKFVCVEYRHHEYQKYDVVHVGDVEYQYPAHSVRVFSVIVGKLAYIIEKAKGEVFVYWGEEVLGPFKEASFCRWYDRTGSLGQLSEKLIFRARCKDEDRVYHGKQYTAYHWISSLEELNGEILWAHKSHVRNRITVQHGPVELFKCDVLHYLDAYSGKLFAYYEKRGKQFLRWGDEIRSFERIALDPDHLWYRGVPLFSVWARSSWHVHYWDRIVARGRKFLNKVSPGEGRDNSLSIFVRKSGSQHLNDRHWVQL